MLGARGLLSKILFLPSLVSCMGSELFVFSEISILQTIGKIYFNCCAETGIYGTLANENSKKNIIHVELRGLLIREPPLRERKGRS